MRNTNSSLIACSFLFVLLTYAAPFQAGQILDERKGKRFSNHTIMHPISRNISERIYAHLQDLKKAPVMAFSLTGVALLGIFDYLTGLEFSFAFFYLIPVSFSSWFAGKREGLFISILSATTWHLANQLAGEGFSNRLIPYWNAASRLGFFFLITLLLSKLHQTLRHEKAISRTDFLTGALNSRAFYDAISSELLRIARYHHPLTLVYIDADNFKIVNDQLGHSAGNTLLQEIAQTITANIRTIDSVARLGGDEFAILLPETDLESSRQMIPRLQQVLLEEMNRSRCPITFSIGALTLTANPRSIDEIISLADGLMYEAKRGGKNAIRYSVYEG